MANEKIESDQAEKIAILDQVLSALATPGLPEALVERARALKLIREELEVRRLRIGVIGITSSGKSTFLNALLGEKLLPEQSIPTSNVLTFLRHGERRLTLSFLDGRKVVVAGESLGPELLLKYTSEASNPENRLQLKRVVLEHPGIPLPPEFELVDTPGLDAFGHEWHQQMTLEQFVPQADVIVYMTSIRNPFKKSDYDALARVLEHDQRVLFIMSCKDLERDDWEGGRLVTSKEQKLAQHLNRLKHDASRFQSLLSAGYVLVDSRQALASGREKGLWHASGFAEVQWHLSNFEKDLGALIADTRFRRAAGHLERVEASTHAYLAKIRGDAEKVREHVADLRARTSFLKENLDKSEKAVRDIVCSKNEDSILAAFNRSKPNRKTSQTALEKLVADCDRNLDTAYTELKTRAERAREILDRSIDEVGLEAPRNPIPEASLDGLPTATIQKTTVEETHTYRRGWFESIKFWPGTETYTKKVQVMDVDRFKTELKARANAGLNRLKHHADVIQKTFQSRYLNLVRGEHQRLQAELANLQEDLANSAGEKQASSLVQLLERARRDMRRGDSAPSPSDDNSRGTWNPSEPGFPQPKTKPSLGSLECLLSSFRELAFHRRVLKAVGLEAAPPDPLRLVLAGLDASDRRRFADLLLHQLGDPGEYWQNDSFIFLGGPGTQFPTFAHQVPVPGSRLWDWIQLVVAPNDDFQDAWTQHGQCLMQWADRVLLLFDGPRIGAGLNSLMNAPYRESLQALRDKVVYVLPHGAKFDDKISDLATEVIPKLLEDGPYGDRPFLIHENYDIRYTEFVDLASEVESVTELRRRWKAMRLSLAPPFTEKALEEVSLIQKSEVA